MTYTIESYLEHAALQLGDCVHLALAAHPCLEDEQRVCSYQNTLYEFSLEMSTLVRGINLQEKHRFPVAQVLCFARANMGYGTMISKVAELSEVLSKYHLPKKTVLTHFFDTPHIGLEQKLSTDSIFYIFAGVMTYAARIAEKIDLGNHPDSLTVGNHALTPELLQELGAITRDCFKGYCIRIVEDEGLCLSTDPTAIQL